MIFVIVPTHRMFENVCVVDWNENPRSKDFVVMTNSMQFLRQSRGHFWEDGDELRMIAPGSVRREVFQEAYQRFVTTNAPQDILDFLRPHL